MRLIIAWSLWLCATLAIQRVFSVPLVSIERAVQGERVTFAEKAHTKDVTVRGAGNSSLGTGNLTKILPAKAFSAVPPEFSIIPLTFGRPVSASTYFLTVIENFAQLSKRNLYEYFSDWHGTGVIEVLGPPLAMRAWPTTSMPVRLRMVYYALVKLSEEQFLAQTGLREMRVKIVFAGRAIARLDISSREGPAVPMLSAVPGNDTIAALEFPLIEGLRGPKEVSARDIVMRYEWDVSSPLDQIATLGGLTQAIAVWIPEGVEAYQEGFQLEAYGLSFTVLNIALESRRPYEVDNDHWIGVVRSAAFQQARVGGYCGLKLEFLEHGQLIGTFTYTRADNGRDRGLG
ncbi:MAG: hypothetical protein Q9191_006235 [Dirinaria sp. TL-2023a]